MKKIVGIMGPREESATKDDLKNAYEIGKFCAAKGYVVLTGGVKSGVMDAGLKGAKDGGGLTIGLLPGKDTSAVSDFVDIPICTGMGAGRNYINAISSDFFVACGMSPGTSSEISFAIQVGKKIILVGLYKEANDFYKKLAGGKNIFVVKDYNDACKVIEKEIGLL
ncbi:MAG: cytochrome [Firmicutes bacterium]|nr:cytochrome [Bacillota bacterium]